MCVFVFPCAFHFLSTQRETYTRAACIHVIHTGTQVPLNVAFCSTRYGDTTFGCTWADLMGGEWQACRAGVANCVVHVLLGAVHCHTHARARAHTHTMLHEKCMHHRVWPMVLSYTIRNRAPTRRRGVHGPPSAKFPSGHHHHPEL